MKFVLASAVCHPVRKLHRLVYPEPSGQLGDHPFDLEVFFDHLTGQAVPVDYALAIPSRKARDRHPEVAAGPHGRIAAMPARGWWIRTKALIGKFGWSNSALRVVKTACCC